MGRFVSATGQFLLATYGQFSCPPMGSFSCPLTAASHKARFEGALERQAWNEPSVSLYTAGPVLADRIGVVVLVGCDS